MSSVGWGRRICWMHHCVRVRIPVSLSVLDMIANCIWWWGSIPGALGNVEYHFIATQVHSDPGQIEIFNHLIYTWNKLTMWKQMTVKLNFYYHIAILKNISLLANKTVNVNNTWNHLTVHKQMSSGLCKNCYWQTNHIYLMYMYKQDLALNNQQGLIGCETQLTNHNPLFTETLMLNESLNINWAYNMVTVSHAEG